MARARARVWTVRDFAEHIGIAPRNAKRMLLRLDRELGGKLLIRSDGPTSRRYTFVRANLAKAHPEYFEAVESTEERIGDLEERLEEAERRIKMLGSTVGSHSFALAKLQHRK